MAVVSDSSCILWNIKISLQYIKEHQDDIYEPAFAKTVLEEVNRHSRPLIAFTDYGELRNG